MTLEFTVEQKENGMLLRDFLRKRGGSAALAKGVKASDGFSGTARPYTRICAFQRASGFPLRCLRSLLRRCCPRRCRWISCMRMPMQWC